MCIALRRSPPSGALEPSAPELLRQRAGNDPSGGYGGLGRLGGCRPLLLATAQRVASLRDSEHLLLERRPPAALGIGRCSRPCKREGELVDVRPRRLGKAFDPEPLARGQGARHAVIETRKARHADLEPSRLEPNAAELAASLVQGYAMDVISRRATCSHRFCG